ncbi:DUF3833 family protein [Ensifer adhaerens]|uniref:DUF3833 family protein n=1 Tax=Ensifer adhaerens TaxID=106592 RepID=UPI001C4DE040|nr:DUF3833 family protein [Ensifer adhaerens]MBW0371373.1 DUF3833 domain-containing protein [Ensifer adhaerens]UCM23630.1 DUF3833 domain-containing protein [Ensifer adhaerens]
MHTISVFLTVIAMNLAVVTPVAAGSFSLEGFFTGRSMAEGSFRSITGVKKTFKLKLLGKWDGRTLTLREDFTFDDGTRDRKTWRFIKDGPGKYRGTREDVIGETEVSIKGNVARFSYLVLLDPENRKNKVRFHDTMTLNADGRLLNSAYVTKFGFPVAWTRVEFSRR